MHAGRRAFFIYPQGRISQVAGKNGALDTISPAKNA